MTTEQDIAQKAEDRKTKYEDIAEKALGMTESIKHAIVLLQIAKNASTPPQHPDQMHGSRLQLSIATVLLPTVPLLLQPRHLIHKILCIAAFLKVRSEDLIQMRN